ncbi:MAG: class I SAM-dependent rRNA methyltransferase [Flavobacteriales bacterium]|nr:class I SAM-dependent rRNA methyltransferase [Flavobacteriales bacterium]
MIRVFITDPQRRVQRGHPWVFDTQVLRQDGEVAPGALVQVVDVKAGPVGTGYFNARSKIRVRLLTHDPTQVVDEQWVRARIQAAWALRQRLLPDVASVRVVFGESDGLPGLVVDKFDQVLVVQVLTLGMEQLRGVIFDELQRLISPLGIFERSDAPVRALEGLELRAGPVGSAFGTQVTIDEAGVRFAIDVATGQKTGHFLDQRENHASMKMVARGAEVLDCFTHTGGFALHAACHGASRVTGLDISAEAVANAQHNAKLNHVADRCSFEQANVFDHLGEMSRKGRSWDVVVLDPPAFAKSKAALPNALRGYKEINLRAMKCIRPGGFLVSCSCSFHLSAPAFDGMLAEAASDAGVWLTEVHRGSQAPDHPVRWGFPESHYLKCVYLHVEPRRTLVQLP